MDMSNLRKYNHDEILALFDQGLEIKDIASQIGCSECLVSVVTRQNDRSAFLRRYPQSEEWSHEAILRDYQGGMPIEKLREKHHISLSHLHRLRKQAGIPTRPRPRLTGKRNGQYKHGLGDRRRERNLSLVQQVVAACLGYVVPLGWQIHHMDGNPTNNHPENLAIFPSKSAHSRYHQQQLNLQRKGLEVDASQLVLENDGWLLPRPDHPILLPHEKGRLDPHRKKMKPEPRPEEC